MEGRMCTTVGLYTCQVTFYTTQALKRQADEPRIPTNNNTPQYKIERTMGYVSGHTH